MMNGAATGTVVCVGLCTRDYVVSVDAIPKQPVKVRALDWRETGGGLAATASVAVARLGGRAFFCGRVGNDAAGQAIRAELGAEGVDTQWLRTMAEGRSPCSMVLVDAQGERLLAAYSDPSLSDDAEWLAPKLEGALLADLTWPRAAIRMLDEARAMHVPGVVDADATRTGADDVHQMLRRATHLVFSRDGLAQHSGESEVLPGLRAMRQLYGVYVGVTDGAHGYHWLEEDRLLHLPAPRIVAVDTNGAGDAFHGAFTLALARGQSERDAARSATLVATLKCTRPGGREGLPDADEASAFFASHDVALK